MESWIFKTDSKFGKNTWGSWELRKLEDNHGNSVYVGVVIKENSVCQGSFSTRDGAEGFIAHPFRVLHAGDLFCHEEIQVTK